MSTLVDTPVWSLALRRRRADLARQEIDLVQQLTQLISHGNAQIIGAVRQELLSGIREDTQFLRIRNDLRSFPDIALLADDYEEAARMSNTCRSKGIVGSPIDMLLCAAASRRDLFIFTIDRDFHHYRRILGINLFRA